MTINVKKTLKQLTGLLDSDDIISREFSVASVRCCLLYLDALSDKMLLEQDILRPLLECKNFTPTDNCLTECFSYGEKVKSTATPDEAAQVIAEGDIILLADGADSFFILSLKKFNFRSVSEPPTETVLKGPREGFVEEIKTNVSMIRRRLKTPSLRVKQFNVGRYSNSTVVLAYVDGIADNNIVEEISRKIKKIDIDGVLDTSYVERFIEEHPYSIFNQAGITEKPDIVVGKLLEGRVAVLVDGSPVVITFPYLLLEGFQDSNDYYIRDTRTSMLRIIRLIGAIVSVMLPGLYVAMQEYHYHLLPLKFLISILNAVQGIPFTPPMEMLFVLLLFEILYQASVRMPRYVGTALSIVGAIVLGETAVNAGLLSSPAVLIIAISAIGINCVPDLVDTFSILRLAILLIGSVLGLFGVIIFSLMLIAYLTGLDAFGTPYLAPFSPTMANDFKDSFLKNNLLDFEDRPYSVKTNNRRRLRRG